MSIDQSDVIDNVTVEHASGDCVLTIADHLPWDRDEGAHLILLQDKLNAYLRFIESGELHKRFPETVGRRIVIAIGAKFPQSAAASQFLDLAAGAIQKAGFRLEFRHIRLN